jgi:signal transduction histidine kinase
VEEIRREFRFLHGIVLLKPVDRARLHVALFQAAIAGTGAVDNDLIRIDRDHVLQCLLKATLKLQEYDQDRARFLSRSLHELRSPLTSLNGYCGLLLEHELGELTARQHMVISRMRHSVQRLSRIVSAMFDLTVGQNIASSPTFSNGDCGSCVEQAVHELDPQFQERGLRVDVQLLPPSGLIRLDRSQIAQVFVNLLDNSCKFTPRGGEIVIRGYPYFWERRHEAEPDRGDGAAPAAQALENSYRIDISDNGPGIPDEQLGRIFEEYTSYRGGSDRSGAGLGLAICHMIVTTHHGCVWAESRSGSGATFSVVLPYTSSQGLIGSQAGQAEQACLT